MKCFTALMTAILLSVTIALEAQTVTLVHPTVEYQDGSQPLATDVPRFSWRYESGDSNVRQTSYRILVASSKDLLDQGVGDLWDSKTVASDRMLLIPYEGKPLHSRDKAYWKVIASTTLHEIADVKHYRDGDFINKTSDTLTRVRFIESDINSFEISLLDSTDWHAQWIGGDFDDDHIEGKTHIASRYLRKEFSLRQDIREARLYISGLGQYSAYINGDEVAPEEILKPALSDYSKRVYFNAYDVTDFLKKGNNAVGVVLAGGRYTSVRFDSTEMEYGGLTHARHFGTPRLLLQLEVTYTDGSKDMIVSDKSWQMTNQGPIRKSNEFDGETYDDFYALGGWTRAGYTFFCHYQDISERWGSAQIVDAPGGKLVPQPNPNIKVQDTLHPVAMFRKGDTWILDMGQNMVGYLQLMMRGLQKGDTVTLRFAELLTPDSMLYTANLRTAEATDRFIIPDPMHAYAWQWHPMFTYHGFRYVEISGLREEPKPEDFQGLVFYDEMAVTGSFECSNEVMNAVYRNAYWGIRGNYRSMPTDCPQRDERMGWTGDRTTGNYGESYIFNNYRLYNKWIDDIADTEEPTGSLSDVCPNYWRRITDNMTWPGAFITVADMLYTRYGDIEPIRRHYPAMKRWMAHMWNKYSEDGIITRDCYGDWCVPPESPELIHSNDPTRITEAGAISTPFYCHLATLMVKFARLLGLPEDEEQFLYEIELAAVSYNDLYFDRGYWQYENGSVTANLLPLAFGLVPEEFEEYVFANILDKTENEFGGHVSTGVVGIQQLMRTLTDRGRGDLALKIATNDTYPSWGYMVRNGATTIWELWNGNTADPAMNSGNHVMLLGDLILWEYEYLGGIRALEPGYSRIQLKPTIIPGLDYVKCAYESVSGRIESSWSVYKGHYEWNVTIPANTKAEVWIPTGSGYVKQVVGSGSHSFAFWLP